MRNPRLYLPTLLLALVILPGFAFAEFPSTQPFPGVTYAFESRKDPALRLYRITIDLANPAITLRVSRGGPDPDGTGPFQTTLMKTSEIAARESFDLAINGDFFAAKSKVDAEGALLRYAPGQPAYVLGPAMTDGTLWAKASSKVRPCLVITDRRQVLITPASQIPPDARQVVAGNMMLVENGKPLPNPSRQVAPRTAVGLDKDRTRLTILIVDGRLPGFSLGLTYTQLASEMVRLGCHTALNLDGGGSSTLVLLHPQTREPRILNTPSDGTERPIANVLGLKITPQSPSRN
ncbi:MAG TPA: phosphodiester glycosidase family protein [Tepidisphaeraceae bacterium]|nr:phosphodiester glycosidase family protein [Tepidisphaeraceae bacterium]